MTDEQQPRLDLLARHRVNHYRLALTPIANAVVKVGGELLLAVAQKDALDILAQEDPKALSEKKLMQKVFGPYMGKDEVEELEDKLCEYIALGQAVVELTELADALDAKWATEDEANPETEA